MTVRMTTGIFFATTHWAANVFALVLFVSFASVAHAAPNAGDTRELRYAELLRDNLALAKASPEEQIAVWRNLVAAPGRNPIPARLATTHTHLGTASRAIDGLLGAGVKLEGAQLSALASTELARLTAHQTILDQTRPKTELTWIKEFTFVPIPAGSRSLTDVRATLKGMVKRNEIVANLTLLPRLMGANNGLEVATLPVTQGQFFSRMGTLPEWLTRGLEVYGDRYDERPVRVQKKRNTHLVQPNHPVDTVSINDLKAYLAAENSALDARGETYRYRILTAPEKLWITTAFGSALEPYPDSDKVHLSRYASFDRDWFTLGSERVGSHEPLFSLDLPGCTHPVGVYDLLGGGGGEFVSRNDSHLILHGGRFLHGARWVHRYALASDNSRGSLRLARVPSDGSNKEFWGDTEYKPEPANAPFASKLQVVSHLAASPSTPIRIMSPSTRTARESTERGGSSRRKPTSSGRTRRRVP